MPFWLKSAKDLRHKMAGYLFYPPRRKVVEPSVKHGRVPPFSPLHPLLWYRPQQQHHNNNRNNNISISIA